MISADVFPSRSSLASPRHIALSALSILIALCFVGVGDAWAVKPEQKYKGKIIVSTERFPSSFKSDAAFIAHMKKANKKTLTADGKAAWTFEYMAFLPEPVSTLKAAVSFYDVTDPKQKRFISTQDFYPGDRKDKILAGHSELSANEFSPDRKYLMVFSRGYGQKPLAQTQFVLRRTGVEKDSGVVDFTDDAD